MILLQTTTANVITWRTYLQDGNQFAQIIGTIMIIIYVIYTYKTFAQIKKQTDYQQDAYLKLEHKIISQITQQDIIHNDGRKTFFKSNLSSKYLNKTISLKLTSILKPIFNFDEKLFEGNYFSVILTNYGNAEVNLIKLHLTISISISKEVAEVKMLKEKEIHTYIIEINEIIGRSGGAITIPLIATASFPSYTISLKGEYFDVRNKKYLISESSINGQNDHFNKLP